MQFLSDHEIVRFRDHYLIFEDVYDRALLKSIRPELGVEEEAWLREVQSKRSPKDLKDFEAFAEWTLDTAVAYEYLVEEVYDFSRYFKRLRFLEYMRNPEAGRPKNYNHYLDSPHWSNLRKHVLDRDGHLCVCGREATDVHHKTYERTGKEYLSDLVSLCDSCHKLIHLIRDRDKDQIHYAF